MQVVTEETVVSVGTSLLSCLEGEVQLLDSLFGAFGACRGELLKRLTAIQERCRHSPAALRVLTHVTMLQVQQLCLMALRAMTQV